MAGTELGKAYVQIVPSAQGISGSISNAIGGEADSAGQKAGSAIGSKIKGAIVAAGIGTALKNTILEGAALEQSIGGIEVPHAHIADDIAERNLEQRPDHLDNDRCRRQNHRTVQKALFRLILHCRTAFGFYSLI